MSAGSIVSETIFIRQTSGRTRVSMSFVAIPLVYSSSPRSSFKSSIKLMTTTTAAPAIPKKKSGTRIFATMRISESILSIVACASVVVVLAKAGDVRLR